MKTQDELFTARERQLASALSEIQHLTMLAISIEKEGQDVPKALADEIDRLAEKAKALLTILSSGIALKN